MPIKIYIEDYFPKGQHNRVVDVEESISLGELLHKLNYMEYEHFALVNGSFQAHSYVLRDEDLVVLIPVLSGG